MNKDKKLLKLCSRCGREYQELGRILQYGNYYPPREVKHADGRIEKLPEHMEILQEFCVECSKETYDSEELTEADKGKAPCITALETSLTKKPKLNIDRIESAGKRVHLLLYGGERENDPQYTEWRADLEAAIHDWIEAYKWLYQSNSIETAPTILAE